MAERYLNTHEIGLEELNEQKKKNWTYKHKYQILVESLVGLGFGERIWS
jgi:hypothetical protein